VNVDLSTGVVTGADGNDTIVPALMGDSTVENIVGSNSNDNLLGDVDNNTIAGRDGNDVIYGRDGDDVLSGEGGNDAIGKKADAHITDNPRFPNQLLPDAADVETENEAGNDRMDGGAGDDFIRGGLGNDVIMGGSGADYIEGDGWRRTGHLVGAGPLLVPYSHLASGDDEIDAGSGADIVFASDEADPFDGDHDPIAMTGFTNPNVTPDIFSPEDTNPADATAAPVADRIQGGADNDILYGHVGVDHLIGDGFGETGSDTAFGLAGNDFLNGADGADTLVGGVGSDQIIGGTGEADDNDLIRIEATGSGGGATLPDTVVITGSPDPDRIEVEGLAIGDVVGQSIVEDLLDDGGLPPGIISDYEPGHDILEFVLPFIDFRV
jgi:Ca2+-binding RTX toxin-like protein